jgi:hypothetical protein
MQCEQSNNYNVAVKAMDFAASCNRLDRAADKRDNNPAIPSMKLSTAVNGNAPVNGRERRLAAQASDWQLLLLQCS